jgi:aspartyl-tRNA(Asn)/glutamyl-tRNA(Gln) amidotransferase subunit A
MIADEAVLFAPIAEVGARYRAGSLSPVEVTRLCLDRIDAHDGDLNAFITVLSDQALDKAATAERELRAGHDRGLLHGIPVGVKDLIDVAGVPTTCGSAAMPDDAAERNARLVDNLVEAGAVILGKTNLLEFAYWVPHPDFGRTNNPWDVTRSASGSSGGSAAAVAAGMCYAAVGTDTGGSIRSPAACCGIVGLKPTYGRVDVDGVFPVSGSLDHVGPMARTCADVALMIGAMTGNTCAAEPRALRGLRLGILAPDPNAPPVSPEVLAAFEAACAALAGAEAVLTGVHIPELAHAMGAQVNVMAPEASMVHARRISEQAADYAEETRYRLDVGFAIPASAYVRAQRFRRYLGSRFLSALEHVDAILSPSMSGVAPVEEAIPEGGSWSDEMDYFMPYNLTGLPAVSIPCGQSPGGLPIGMQIAARPHADALVLSIGAAFERLIPPRAPTLYSHET